MKNKLLPWKNNDKSLGFWRDEHPFDLLHREIDDLFESHYGGFGNRGIRQMSVPGFRISETDDEVRVKAELPGMEEKDIEVTLDEGVLTIRGERKEQHEEKKRNYRLSKMSYGSFQQSFTLKATIDREKATASFKHGVLMLTLPKTEKAEHRRIPVHTG